jgi:hypothetical protein
MGEILLPLRGEGGANGGGVGRGPGGVGDLGELLRWTREVAANPVAARPVPAEVKARKRQVLALRRARYLRMEDVANADELPSFFKVSSFTQFPICCPYIARLASCLIRARWCLLLHLGFCHFVLFPFVPLGLAFWMCFCVWTLESQPRNGRVLTIDRSCPVHRICHWHYNRIKSQPA